MPIRYSTIHIDHLTLYDTISDSLDPPLSLSDSTPFNSGKEIAIPIPEDDQGYLDIYINDTIGVTPDLHNNYHRMSRVIPLAICTLARPLDTTDIIPRKDIISTKKYQVKGRMEEQKTVLGWILNTISLRISLPPNKHDKWTNEIEASSQYPKYAGNT